MNITQPASTSTPASEISREQFERDDSVDNSAELEAKLLGDILRNSPAANMIGIQSEESLPDEEEAAPTTDSSDEVDPDAEEQSENDPDEGDQEPDSEEEQESEDDKNSTQDDTDLPTEDDIDWDYKVPVSIDGKVEYKSLQELRKGFATDQHLSQKGREIGELRKQIDAERDTKLKEIVDLGAVLHNELLAEENAVATSYNEIEKQIKEAREIGDTFTARELKEKRDELAEKYWSVRKTREEKISKVADEIKKQQLAQQENLLKDFQENIPKFIPDFNDKVATSIREFAIKEGVPEDLLNSVFSPAVVKFINDYRVLKSSLEKGSVKRKAPAAGKSVPTKKGTPATVAQKRAVDANRAKALSGEASNREQLDFLRSISKVSQKL